MFNPTFKVLQSANCALEEIISQVEWKMTWWDKVKGSNYNLACCFVLLLHQKVVVLAALHTTSVCDLAPHQITNFILLLYIVVLPLPLT